jgi:hypothetical protein
VVLLAGGEIELRVPRQALDDSEQLAIDVGVLREPIAAEGVDRSSIADRRQDFGQNLLEVAPAAGISENRRLLPVGGRRKQPLAKLLPVDPQILLDGGVPRPAPFRLLCQPSIRTPSTSKKIFIAPRPNSGLGPGYPIAGPDCLADTVVRPWSTATVRKPGGRNG